MANPELKLSGSTINIKNLIKKFKNYKHIKKISIGYFVKHKKEIVKKNKLGFK